MYKIIIGLVPVILGLYSTSYLAGFFGAMAQTPYIVVLSIYLLIILYLTIEVMVFVLHQMQVIEKGDQVKNIWLGHVFSMLGAVSLAASSLNWSAPLIALGVVFTATAIGLLTIVEKKLVVTSLAASSDEPYLPNALKDIPSAKQRNTKKEADLGESEASESSASQSGTSKSQHDNAKDRPEEKKQAETSKVVDFKSYKTRSTQNKAEIKQQTQSQDNIEAVQAIKQIVQPGMKASVRSAILQQRKEDPLIALKIGGEEIAQTLFELLAGQKGVRAECALGMVGALAGYSCHLWAMMEFQSLGSANAPQAFIPIKDKAGRVYYYGNLPNQALIEDTYSVWSIVGGIARSLSDKPLFDINEIAEETVNSVGETFGVPQLPKEHMPSELPINFVKVLWPIMEPKINQFCETPRQRPMLLAFAAREIIDRCKETICPMLAAEIVMKCAFPMSKIGSEWLEAEYKRPY